jgi:NAD(P)-dependent dehydrogenase (short-subunit alcohol dehydrogenase family)
MSDVMDRSLDGRHIVVTGGTGALGGAVVTRLLEAGAICHIPSHGTAQSEHFDLADHHSVRVAYGVDLTDAAAVDAFFDPVEALWGSVHLAGGFAFGGLDKSAPDDLTKMLRINAETAWLSCRAAARVMHAGGKGGRIVNVAARPALEPRSGAGMAAYAASKAAVAAMTAALGEELKSAGILVNAIAPSILDTPANRGGMPKADFDKWPSLQSAADLIAFLVSPQNASTSSAVIPLYGRA